MKATVSIIVLLLAGAVGVFFLTKNDGKDMYQPEIVPAEAESEDAPATPMEASAPAKDLTGVNNKELPKKYRLYFPDGSWLPTLNGAKNCKPVQFKSRPYSPVVRRDFDTQSRIHYYVHADGTRTTTLKSPWRGEMNHVTAIMHPTHKEGPNYKRPPIAIEKPGKGVVGWLDPYTGKPIGKWKSGPTKAAKQRQRKIQAPKAAAHSKTK